MRRFLVVAVAALAILGFVVPAAQAQAPSPKVTIDGFLDQTTSWSSNMSIFDIDLDREDDEWYGRTRGQFQITGEVGKVKGFLKFEQDNTWGDVTLEGNSVRDRATDSRAPFAARDTSLNTELLGNVEMLWIYTEFPFTGPGSLLPFVPLNGLARIGIQPFVDETYKLSVLAVGQFGGAHIDLDLVPGVKLQWTYAQVDEERTGRHDKYERGDDWSTIVGVELSPFMGVKVKPVYAYYSGDGTAGAPRQGGRGGVADSSAFFPQGAQESRHTVGLDAVLTFGPFSVYPTVLYQFGDRDIVPGGTNIFPTGDPRFPGTCSGQCRSQDISAWLFDLRAGWQAGPLLVEGLFLYTTGNEAKDNVGDSAALGLDDVNFYQAIDTYSGFGAGWGSITALMHDYLTNIFYNAGGLNPATSIGYDKYGRIQLAARAFYSLTPNFKLRGVVTGIWTAEDVDNRGQTGVEEPGGNTTYKGGLNCPNGFTGGTNGDVGGCGLVPSAARDGKDNYIGTEINFGFDWYFAPNISLYVIYGHLFAGDALGNANSGSFKNPDDVDILSAVVRYSF